jgi:hypothetical protein
VPLKSKAQERKMRELEARGKVPKGTTDKWLAETPDPKGLPERTTPSRKPKSIQEIREIAVKKYGRK